MMVYVFRCVPHVSHVFAHFFRGFHHSTASTPSLRQLNAELPQLLAEAEQLQAERVPGVEGVGGVQDKDRDLDGI